MIKYQPYSRVAVDVLLCRLSEPPHLLIVVAGPRQVGKTTLVRDALAKYSRDQYRFVAIDQSDESFLSD
jgi:predicted AAA+ superfamily ATPase